MLYNSRLVRCFCKTLRFLECKSCLSHIAVIKNGTYEVFVHLPTSKNIGNASQVFI